MTKKVNGKTGILTTCKAETPENIETKIGVSNYVLESYRKQQKLAYHMITCKFPVSYMIQHNVSRS